MAYIFKGSIHGALCSDCFEPLRRTDAQILPRCARAQRDSACRSEREGHVHASRRCCGQREETAASWESLVIDERGNFTMEFPESSRYDGEAFEIDLYCGTVPRLKPRPRPPTPLQFTITVAQPIWRRVDNNSVAAWEDTIPYRYWCLIRGRFGAWTICGVRAPLRHQRTYRRRTRACLRCRLAAKRRTRRCRDRRHRPFPHRLLRRRLREDDFLAGDQS